MTETLSVAQARRISLAAQGFAGARGRRAPGRGELRGLIERLRLLQIDSVNVWERSHYMPAFSRLGAYDRALLDGLSEPDGTGWPWLGEYWAHMAAFVPVEDLPLFAFRKQRMAQRGDPDFRQQTRALRAWLRAEIAARGPLRASEITHEDNTRSGTWWGWSKVKRCLEHMFLEGELAAASRIGFERRYGLPEQLLPSAALASVPEREAIRELVRRAAIAHGVGTADDLADYFRLSLGETRRAIEELREAGELVPVEVEGWVHRERPIPTWLHRDAEVPGRLTRTTLLSPFDPVTWHRDRAERLHGFHYRIEIYLPAAKRRYGYYSLPVLVGERLRARVDLKNDRAARVLRVRSAWLEPGAPASTPARIAAAIRDAAEWQGLSGITVEARGDLAGPLASELAVPLDAAG